MMLKRSAEDFLVRELIDLNVMESGAYLYLSLRKRDLTTVEAIKRLAIALSAGVKDFSYAGLKDRVAVTEQFCSWKNGSRRKLESVSVSGLSVEFIGFGSEPVHIGQNRSNFFRIVVRDVYEKPELKPKFVNFFGEQRLQGNNVEIGRALVKKDFKLAAGLLQQQGHVRFAGEDYVGALRSVPLKLLRLMVHSYQSFIWNKAALEWSKRTKEDILLPVVGFGTEDVDEVTERILREEGISRRDFIVRELPELSSEGDMRHLYARAEGLRVWKEDDSVVFEFTLPKGCYATEFVRQCFQ